MHMNYSQIMSPPSPFASKSGRVMTPQLLWVRRPWLSLSDKYGDCSAGGGRLHVAGPLTAKRNFVVQLQSRRI